MTEFPQKFVADLEGAFQKKKPIHIIGAQNTLGLAALLMSPGYLYFHKHPQLIVVPNEDVAQQLHASLTFFNPKALIHILDGFDVSPYSGLYPNFRALSKRMFWLYRAQYSTGGEVFIAPISALLQKTLPRNVFDANIFSFRLNDEIRPEFLKKLSLLGYQNVPRVEDVGQFCIKGGLLDIFSPAHEFPVRIELFGDSIESFRYFHPESQRTLDPTQELVIIPAREVIYQEGTQEKVLKHLNEAYQYSSFAKETREFLYENLVLKRFFHGIDFLFPYFYNETQSVLDYFTHSVCAFYYDPIEITRQADLVLSDLKEDSGNSSDLIVSRFEDIYFTNSELPLPEDSYSVQVSNLEVHDYQDDKDDKYFNLYYKVSTLTTPKLDSKERLLHVEEKLKYAQSKNIKILIATRTSGQAERIKLILEEAALICRIHPEDFYDFSSTQESLGIVDIIPRAIPENANFEAENVLFLREEDFFGDKEVRAKRKAPAPTHTKNLILSDLRVGDLVVHNDFGVGIYEGLKTMNVQGIESEFVLLKYKDDDRLYVPVYRMNLIRKYSGISPLDKMGHGAWAKTKIKVKSHLRDVTSELLALYARRAQATRPVFSAPDLEYTQFEAQFPYDETPDQESAIHAILDDLQKTSPMDRLICGDVGFGKTEVAMRAAFKCVQEKKQAAVLVPTTVLSFQHAESFKKRFKGWPIVIENLSRFTPPKKAKEIVQKLKTGEVDIVIGTHRLLSKDIQLKDLGILIVDEEHKFGVTHKEKIRKLKASIDTIAMSATPIPRTLNMSLMGIRDLSIINTPPQDRLPIRTFICKFEESIIKKSIETELQRGGQVFFLHNRVQSIHEITQTVQELVPEARVKFAHGQMDEDDLEKTMVSFFNHEFDVLVCTTIIESGMDVPRANTILINRADTLGLSQLYQLRGRVGRSKERAYCYLLIPKSGTIDPIAQERLKVLQENTDLGSGIRVAHYDLELRGAGNLLGEEQAGHANAVGYELYVELLDQALREARGENIEKETLEPEINLRIPALIPDEFIPDIRTRMSYYFELSKIQNPEDMDRFEEELNDQFGKVPEAVMNLMGVMLLKKYCKDLGIRDLSAGTKSISLAFADFTPMKSEYMIELITGHPKKYSLTPDSRLIVQMQEISWPQIYKELSYLLDQV